MNTIVEEDLQHIVSANLPWADLAGATVLVSGANGFVPAFLVEALLFLNEKNPDLKIQVLGLVRNREKARARFADYAARDDLELIVQDVSAPLRIERRVDYIIHAASQASPRFYGIDPVGTLSANVLGTANLLELAREHKSRGFLFFSSAEVYGQLDASRIPTAEHSYGAIDSLDVRSCYAESKRMGETMCVSWHKQHDVPAKIVRLFHTYGPGMSLDDGRVYADFVADVACGRDIVMKSDGSASRAFCYLADAITGCLYVLLRGAAGQAYNVGNEHGETGILELAKTMVALFPEKSLRVVEQPRPQDGRYLKSPVSRSCPDTTKLRALGWQPRSSIADGFRRTVLWAESALANDGHALSPNERTPDEATPKATTSAPGGMKQRGMKQS